MSVFKDGFTNIWNTLVGAVGYVYAYRKPLGKALLFPLLVTVLIGLYKPGPEQEFVLAFVLLSSLASILVYTIVAIITHRVILLGPSSVPEWGIFIPTKRELSFMLYSLGLGFILMIIGFLSFIPIIGFPIAVISIAYVFARLSLVFPAIATDQAWTFEKSWEATKDHQVLMMAIVVIFPFMIGVSEQLLSYLPYGAILVNVASTLTTVFVVAALSMVFNIVTEREGVAA